MRGHTNFIQTNRRNYMHKGSTNIIKYFLLIPNLHIEGHTNLIQTNRCNYMHQGSTKSIKYFLIIPNLHTYGTY